MTIINWSDIVGESTIENGGYVGDLLKLARLHVSEALADGELTQQEAGTIYTNMIPSAFQHGTNFALSKQVQEAQADKLDFDKKQNLFGTQLGVIAEAYKNKQIDTLTEVIGNQSEIEELYNSMLEDVGSVPTTIIPSE